MKIFVHCFTEFEIINIILSHKTPPISKAIGERLTNILAFSQQVNEFKIKEPIHINKDRIVSVNRSFLLKFNKNILFFFSLCEIKESPEIAKIQ